MKVSKFLLYLKGIVMFPYYIKRLYDHYQYSVSTAPGSANTIREKHLSIHADLQRCNATTVGDILTINGLKVRLHPSRVLETIHEVILRRDYEFFDDGGDFVMIDIGMNVGFATLLCANNPKFIRIYSFEPLKPTYDIAVNNIALNPSLKHKIQSHNFGLSDTDQQVTVKFSFDEIMSISSEATFDECITTNVRSENIELKRASDVLRPIFERHKADKIFLKMDCEGAEFKIMHDIIQNGMLTAVDVLVLEWHNQEPDRIIQQLIEAGFFCFIQKINIEWNVGMLKAVRI